MALGKVQKHRNSRRYKHLWHDKAERYEANLLPACSSVPFNIVRQIGVRLLFSQPQSSKPVLTQRVLRNRWTLYSSELSPAGFFPRPGSEGSSPPSPLPKPPQESVASSSMESLDYVNYNNMSNRYSREEKKKWMAAPSLPKNKPPVQIPESDTADLIEENQFTLIGALGPHLFQFRFENERDLLTIINKAPFHFKKWMLLIQHWEPVVSESFPALIPFWIEIHGVPLHYWYDTAIRAIGNELGIVEDCVPSRARDRVLINGLNPLEMVRDILHPSGETKQVEFAYDKLEKHCFKCFSLTHEKNDCPFLDNTRDRSPKRLGISQNNTMIRLDDRRRKYEERKREQAPKDPHYRENPTPYARRIEYSERREDSRYHSRQNQSYVLVTSKYCRGREENSRRPLSQTPAASVRTGSRRENPVSEHPSRELETRYNDKRHARLEQEYLRSHDSCSKSIQSPVIPTAVLTSTDLRRSLPAREEGNRSNALQATPPPNDRLPTKNGLSLPSNGKSLLATQGTSTGSSRLQDIEIQYFEETINPIPIGSNSRPSGSRPPGAPLSPPDVISPI
ncbi:hypothetical protein DY000_02005888 [Brassica cretica]|uniref:DUF4283 domain-containing protein n=1 Tax=Brassica cretica TaxID=69181 RepID=A0ABQ7CF22_BRACR|nr:hypothetical protein DY000_02005888 [Brassica cretica]